MLAERQTDAQTDELITILCIPAGVESTVTFWSKREERDQVALTAAIAL